MNYLIVYTKKTVYTFITYIKYAQSALSKS